MRRTIEELLADVPIDFGGGCSVEKAHVLAWLIRHGRLAASVDVGVYRGRSFIPQAWAHRMYTGGIAYGVDPYSRVEACQHDNPRLADELDRWVETTDFDDLYDDVQDICRRLGLRDNSELMRMTSSAAAKGFVDRGVSLGLIHIDGNHDTAAVTQDVRDYMPLLQIGGFLVLDDISWTSVRPAVELAAEQLIRIYQHVDDYNDFAVFWKGGSRVRAALLSAALRRVGRPG